MAHSSPLFDWTRDTRDVTVFIVYTRAVSLSSTSISYIVNFFILFGKNFIHKQKFSTSQPTFPHFLIEIDTFLKSLRLIKNKKSDRFLKYYDDIFNTTDA